MSEIDILRKNFFDNLQEIERLNNIINELEKYFKEKDNELIQKRIRNLINTFASASLSTHQVTNDDLRVILDNFLNGGKTTQFGTVMS